MHRHAPIQERLRNTYFAGDMDMRRCAADRIDEVERDNEALRDRVALLEHRLELADKQREVEPFMQRFLRGRAS